LIANLAQPAVLVQALPILAVALALGGAGLARVVALAGVAMSFLLLIAVSQATGLLLYALARNRRLHDMLLLFGLPLGFALSFVPFLLLGVAPGSFQRALRWIAETDPCALSPFAWGVRAAVHGVYGEVGRAALNAGLAVAAIAAVLGLSALLAGRIHRSELLFQAWVERPLAARCRLWLPGAIGALIEKDLRTAWRDPGLKATLLLGLLGPFVLLFFFSRGGATLEPAMLLVFSLFVGPSPFGSTAGASWSRKTPCSSSCACRRSWSSVWLRACSPRPRCCRPRLRLCWWSGPWRPVSTTSTRSCSRSLHQPRVKTRRRAPRAAVDWERPSWLQRVYL
jgi:hypothetical protein